MFYQYPKYSKNEIKILGYVDFSVYMYTIEL